MNSQNKKLIALVMLNIIGVIFNLVSIHYAASELNKILNWIGASMSFAGLLISSYLLKNSLVKDGFIQIKSNL